MVAGDPKDSLCLGFSDDGEPSGTAGKPMLAQLQGSGIGQIACVIVRYSGGIKLGTGGLVRAYGQGVAQALAKLETSDFIPSCKLLLQGSYDDSGRIERFLSSNNIEVVERSFEAQTRWIVKLGIQQRAQTEARLIQLCSGNIEIQGL